MALLTKNFVRAENILLQQGAVDDAITMYRQMHKWPDALVCVASLVSYKIEIMTWSGVPWTDFPTSGLS